jgi:hypothetical protein
MEQQKFNPGEWLHKDLDISSPEEISLRVKEIVKSIENAKVDIATHYNEWRDAGFALANALGENGRRYFHRISSFHPDYDSQRADTQYTNCLKSNGQGITIRTFFYLAKNAGIDITGITMPKPETDEQLPVLDIYREHQLPLWLRKVVEPGETGIQRDILFMAAVTTISACLTMVNGLYDGMTVFSNLYLFITSRASAGKGRVAPIRFLVESIHKELVEQGKLMRRQFENEMAEYRHNKDENAEKPVKPPVKLLFIPANSSSTGVFQLLFENEGRGLIFETEGDTLSQILKSDYGNYSDGFRKAFHHEKISYYRRTDREHCEIDFPCLSAVLTGTPGQIAGLIPNAENGLFSRFIFYYMNIIPEWRNVFLANNLKGLIQYYTNLGKVFHDFYTKLKYGPDLEFILTPAQQDTFNEFFHSIQETYLGIYGVEYLASIRRLGLIAFRLAMILSTLRLMEKDNLKGNVIECSDEDLQTVLSIIKVLVKHSCKVFSELPEEVKVVPRKSRKEKFFEALPKEFNHKKMVEISNNIDIPEKTANRFLTELKNSGVLISIAHGHYCKKEI